MQIWKINFVEMLGDMEYLECQYAIAETFDEAQDIAHEIFMNYFGDETEIVNGNVSDGYSRLVEIRDIEEFTGINCHTRNGDEILVPILINSHQNSI
jgi:hypothetical protein